MTVVPCHRGVATAAQAALRQSALRLCDVADTAVWPHTVTSVVITKQLNGNSVAQRGELRKAPVV